MARRDAKSIDNECEALLAFAEAFLRQLHQYGRADKAYYEKKVKTLREYTAPTPFGVSKWASVIFSK